MTRERRQTWVGFRATKAEAQAIGDAAERAHISISGWIRMIVLRACEMEQTAPRQVTSGDEFLGQELRNWPVSVRKAVFELGRAMSASLREPDKGENNPEDRARSERNNKPGKRGA